MHKTDHLPRDWSKHMDDTVRYIRKYAAYDRLHLNLPWYCCLQALSRFVRGEEPGVVAIGGLVQVGGLAEAALRIETEMKELAVALKPLMEQKPDLGMLLPGLEGKYAATMVDLYCANVALGWEPELWFYKGHDVAVLKRLNEQDYIVPVQYFGDPRSIDAEVRRQLAMGGQRRYLQMFPTLKLLHHVYEHITGHAREYDVRTGQKPVMTCRSTEETQPPCSKTS